MTFNRAAGQLRERGVSKVLGFKGKTDLSKAQETLVQTMGTGDANRMIMEKTSPNGDTILTGMIGKKLFGNPRRDIVQLCPIVDIEVEILANLIALAVSDDNLANPNLLRILNQGKPNAGAKFKTRLERELGIPLQAISS